MMELMRENTPDLHSAIQNNLHMLIHHATGITGMGRRLIPDILLSFDRLNEINQVSIQICKDADCAIVFSGWLTHNPDLMGKEVGIVSLKIICIEKEKDPAARLIPDMSCLRFIGCFGEQDPAAI